MLQNIITAIYIIATLGTTVAVLLDRRQPSKTVAWVMVLLFIPVVGIVLYFFFGQNTRKERIISQRSLDQLTRRSMFEFVEQDDVDIPEHYKALATLFVNQQKISDDVRRYLMQEGVAVDSYENVRQGLKDYFEYNILMDPDEVNYVLFNSCKCEKVEAESPVKRMKTVKNATEQAGFRRAMLRDGVAMVRFLKWLEKNGVQTELSASQKLESLRAEQPLYQGLSFDTIAAYGPHGAIVHYEPTPESDVPLKPEGLLLLDSGAQYLDGTTDITRTIALGPLTEEMKRVYTLVLKGHIQIELARFPSGVSGTQLDVLAKQAMWREGYSYMHGTGHGVGAYLNVHEGPHQIRMEWKPAPLLAGMTVTDEPGIYLENRFGVRIENTLLIVPAQSTEFGDFLQFESLTLCPIDKRPILEEMLSDEERGWLDDYHATVYDHLSPCLDEDERAWLRQATLPL